MLLILDLKRPFRQPPALRIITPALAVVAHVLSEATKEVGIRGFQSKLVSRIGTSGLNHDPVAYLDVQPLAGILFAIAS